MKEQLQRLALRIDAWTLRERVLLFAALVTLLIMIPYSFSVQPALRKQRLVLDRILQDQSQINAMQQQIHQLVSAQAEEADLPTRARLDGLEKRLVEMEEEIAQKQRQLLPSDKVSDLLRSILGKASSVELVSLTSSSGGEPVEPAPAEAAVSDAKGSKAPPVPKVEIYRHGVEITLRGTYADLTSYLAELERSPWRLVWGPLRLDVEKYPVVTMRASVYTLSTEKRAFSF